MTDNLRGILAILASSAAFVVNDAIVKTVSAELPNSQIIVLRGLMATAILALAATIAGAWCHPRALLQKPMLVRLLASGAATLFIVASLRHLPLATTSALLQVTPLIVTAGAALLLGAKVGPHRWMASLLGFAGVLFIVKPGTDSFVPEVWIALTALIFTATRDLATRFVDPFGPVPDDRRRILGRGDIGGLRLVVVRGLGVTVAAIDRSAGRRRMLSLLRLLSRHRRHACR